MGSDSKSYIDASGKGVSHNQRRRHKVVGAHLRVDAAFKVAIAAEHGDRDQPVIFIDCETSVGSGPELPMQVVQP